MNRFFVIPAGLLAILVIALVSGLLLDPHAPPSPYIDKPAPTFSLPNLKNPNKELNNKDFVGKVWLVNVWASWCVTCRDEHPLLMDLARNGRVSLFGLNYKDRQEDAIRWLSQMGDPYRLVGSDTTGQVGFDWGVKGTPESFVVDRQGTIRFVQAGPLNGDVLKNEILPLIERLQGEHPL
ncbi:Thiol:disulfide interchange protein DsbE [Gammaproteobacteria bacterium]